MKRNLIIIAIIVIIIVLGYMYFPSSPIRDDGTIDTAQIYKDERIYVYCKAGGRAEQAKTILEENGFTNVINIGGLSDWEASGGEVVR